MTTPFPQLRFRLVLGRSIAVGPGKADLLAAVAATGSITAAGRSMGMSYKRAWYLIDTMNRCFREPLSSPPAKAGKAMAARGSRRWGNEVLSLYRTIETQAAAATAAESQDVRPAGRGSSRQSPPRQAHRFPIIVDWLYRHGRAVMAVWTRRKFFGRAVALGSVPERHGQCGRSGRAAYCGSVADLQFALDEVVRDALQGGQRP